MVKLVIPIPLEQQSLISAVRQYTVGCHSTHSDSLASCVRDTWSWCSGQTIRMWT